MNDKSLLWKIMNAKCVEFWKRLFRGHRDKRMKKKNVLLFFESDPPVPSLSHINQHPRFFLYFCSSSSISLSPPLLLFLVFLSPKINITYKTQWKKYYYQVNVLSYFCRVIFSKNAHFPTEKMKWKCMQTHREKKQRTSRSFKVGFFFKKKILNGEMKLSEWGMRKKERSHVGKILEMTKDRSPARLRWRIWPSKMEEQQKQKKLRDSKAPGFTLWDYKRGMETRKESPEIVLWVFIEGSDAVMCRR